MELKGVITALITPFINNEIDKKGYQQNIRFQIEQGINGIVTAAATGESATLTSDEQAELLSIAVKEAKGKILILASTGHNSTREAVERTKQAKEIGADAVLVVTPYYNKPTQEGIYLHFKAIVESVNIPVVVYNNQGRTVSNVETPTLLKIAELPNIVAVKESSGNILQAGDVIHQIVNRYPHFTLLSGDDIHTFPMMALGAKGVISIVSNLIPAQMIRFINAALQGQYEQARQLHYELLPLFKSAFMEVNPLPIKEAMNMCGFAAGSYRLPLCEMLPENKQKLHQLLRQMQLIK